MKDPRLQPLWTRGFGNECGRLFQGIRDITGTDTCFFTTLKNIPKDRKITYGKIVCDYKPHKQEKERVRLTVGGDKLDYSGDECCFNFVLFLDWFHFQTVERRAKKYVRTKAYFYVVHSRLTSRDRKNMK
jgi:hypothetical protein